MPDKAQCIQRHTYSNIKQEISHIALEIKACLDKDPHPDLPYGVVVPQLSEHWRLINDIFTDVFSPYDRVPVGEKSELPFNISAGNPLYDVNIIHSIWILLDILTSDPSVQTWTQLCRSPFIEGGMTEMATRSQWEFTLRKPQTLYLDWNWVLERKDIPEILKKCLDGAFTMLNNKPHQEKPSVWHSWLLEYLKQWGWPGERNLNSEEYQAVMHFYRLLNELPSMDLIMQKVDIKTVISQLKTQALARMFQPESEDKPIQVLGMLEAAGQQFNQLWITGMSFDIWPQRPNPNPFIPTHIQVSENMPHANAQREYDYAQALLNRLVTASNTLHFSYSKYDLNGDSARLPSPLIQDYPEKDVSTISSEINLLNALMGTQKITPLPETNGIELVEGNVKGGSGIFKSQAACPFQAYAKYRLNATTPELPVLGISAITKGNVLHKTLETLWGFIKDQDKLLTYDAEELTALAADYLDQVLRQVNPTLPIQQQRLEKRRALPLIVKWLMLEKTRPSFKIHALEKAMQVNVNGISLNVRQDRVDELSDGSYLLIDYKSGEVKSKDWLGERPDEPQLPLYATLMETPPSGIAFGMLQCKEVDLISLDESNTDWQKQLQDWRQSIETLALEFSRGRADLDPKHGDQTCQRCDLQLFCRIDEYEYT